MRFGKALRILVLLALLRGTVCPPPFRHAHRAAKHQEVAEQLLSDPEEVVQVPSIVHVLGDVEGERQ